MYAADISAPDSFYEKWYGLLPHLRRTRCDRFKTPDDRKRCIMAYALLAFGIGELLKDHPKIAGDCPFGLPDPVERDGGKPYIEGFCADFNISHSGGRVAVAISPADVGCDVECKERDALKIAKRFFAPAEYEYLRSICDEDKLGREFTALWTLKESVVKCRGEGIRYPFYDFSVVDEGGVRKDSIRFSPDGPAFFLKEYESENGYCYSVCSLSDDMEDTIRFTDWEMITV